MHRLAAVCSQAAAALGDNIAFIRPLRYTTEMPPPPPPPIVTFRRVAVCLQGPGQSPVLPFACCVGSMLSVGRCGRCSLWCGFHVMWPSSWRAVRVVLRVAGIVYGFCCPLSSTSRSSTTCLAGGGDRDWCAVSPSPDATPPPPCPDTGLSKHSDPAFPHFWVFFGVITLAVPIQQKMWFVGCRRGEYGCENTGSPCLDKPVLPPRGTYDRTHVAGISQPDPSKHKPLPRTRTRSQNKNTPACSY